jgi:hypothetical protein
MIKVIKQMSKRFELLSVAFVNLRIVEKTLAVVGSLSMISLIQAK